MGDEELLRERIKIGQPVNFYPWTRSIDYPHQKVVHHVGKLEGRYTFANKSRLSVKAAWQHDDRREYNTQVFRGSWMGDYDDANTFLDLFVSGGGSTRRTEPSRFSSRMLRRAQASIG